MEENKQHKTALPETEPIPSAQAPEALLDIRGLRVEYHTDEDVVYAVNGLDLTIGKGESLGLVGETGAGKTTTALSVLRLIADPPGKIMGGEIWFEGEDMLQAKPARLREIRGSKISVIFQDPMTSLNPVYSVGDQIAEVIHQHEKCSKEEGRRKAGDMLEMVGIPRARYDEYPHQFSGGMKQRVVIAMSIACSPELILADEPTTALDVTIQAQVLELMNELKEKLRTSLLLITHDLGVVAQNCRLGILVLFEQVIPKYMDLADQYNLEMTVLQRSIPVTALMSKSHPLANSSRVSLKDLTGYPFIADAHIDPDDTLDVLGLQSHTDLLYICDRGTIFDAVRKGNYIAIGISIPEEDARRMNCVCCPIADGAPMAVALLHSRTFTLRPREKHFIRYLTDRLHKRYSG
ncbi:ATP-binding cassette domain-containing protein [Dysosmobacter welbionis]|uniref:ATP-binding cassette domain-containing protein n=1 Tax=Dysosmobacter welbionis TaxID=2093857 RepID=UPI002356E356|nr:ATP-binding cassette domain-containing protein [Dysosmobacter welbionis]